MKKLFFFFTFFLVHSLLYAQLRDGDLDLTFNNTGKVFSGIGTGADEIYFSTVQSDGKIIATGYSTSNSIRSVAVVRYNENGTLDNSFGTNGITTYSAGAQFSFGWEAVILPDNKILIGCEYKDGTNLSGFAILKLNSNGTRDLSFGDSGRVKIQYSNTENIALALKVQNDGKIVMGGFYRNPTPTPKANFLLLRFKSDGVIDSSFGTNGFAATNLSQIVASVHDDNGIYDLEILPDGKILAVGDVRVSSGNQLLALARFNSNGTLDSGFGTNGVGTIDLAGSVDFGWAMKVLPDGKILTAGFSNSGSSSMESLLARFNSNGTLDNTFGNNGTVVTPVTMANDHGYAVASSSVGKIYVGVFSDNSVGSDFTILAYNHDGSPDTSFGTAGLVTTDFNFAKDVSRHLTIAPDGKLVVTGSATVSGKVNFALARYHIAGVVPVELTSFGFRQDENRILLNWVTATETNNYGFEIERAGNTLSASGEMSWEKIGFVKGFGTTTEARSYSFSDPQPLRGISYYRLKQIDHDGRFEYSSEIEVDFSVPSEFLLSQNYPNPFNPSTQISFTVAGEGLTKLSIFSASGEQVAELFNQNALPGRQYLVSFDASGFTSGIYFYRLTQGNIVLTKKMTLVK
ncbi:MAG: T9SS type A sorting domain-containing protein [Ignavibacteriaceae bacterium]|nr:T9SS type A sorting domain-containing protein [Ignavibacteriaceae bacterium]MCK6615962.1 T9SS type A sorting domain-containing protein [Ignavibacteriaceae bacterium]